MLNTKHYVAKVHNLMYCSAILFAFKLVSEG